MLSHIVLFLGKVHDRQDSLLHLFAKRDKELGRHEESNKLWGFQSRRYRLGKRVFQNKKDRHRKRIRI